MKYIVTGSAGFIGYHLCLKLLENKRNKVLGIDNMNNYYSVKVKKVRNSKLNEYKNYSFLKEDLTNSKKIEKIFKNFKPEIIINLAAQAGVRYSIENPSSYISSNLLGFFNILNLSKKFNVKHFFYASSSSVYGDQKKLPIKINSSTDHPLSLYAATKKSNEIIAESYSNIFKMNCSGFRFFTNYGNFGRPDMSIYKFCELMTKNKNIEVFNKGKHNRDFTHISDSINFLIRIINKRLTEKGHKVFNIASGKKIALMKIIRLIEKEMGFGAKITYKKMQKGDVKETHASILETVNYTNYKPSKKIEDGIKEFVSWYKKFKY
tara:strand:- start:39 stop:1001 length:963 start_codon:yes stop_codon:yes gene_type:complete